MAIIGTFSHTRYKFSFVTVVKYFESFWAVEKNLFWFKLIWLLFGLRVENVGLLFSPPHGHTWDVDFHLFGSSSSHLSVNYLSTSVTR